MNPAPNMVALERLLASLDFSVFMTFTSWLTPGTMADPNTDWFNEANAQADDGAVADSNHSLIGTPRGPLRATNFGFDAEFDDADTIVSVEVRIDRREQGVSSRFVQDQTVQLVVGGSPTGDNNANTGVNWPGTLAKLTYAPGGDWTTSLTAAQARATDFGVDLTIVGTHASQTEIGEVDVIEMRIEFTAAGGGASFIPKLGMIT